jgi:hypothetical protein
MLQSGMKQKTSSVSLGIPSLHASA